jgi:hypothetical protein
VTLAFGFISLAVIPAINPDAPPPIIAILIPDFTFSKINKKWRAITLHSKHY